MKQQIWVVTNGDFYASDTQVPTQFLETAKPYLSLWRAQFRAWRMNRSGKRYVRHYLSSPKFWFALAVDPETLR